MPARARRHVPAAFHPRRTALARQQHHPQRRAARPLPALFGGKVQAPHRRQAGNARKLANHQRHDAGTQDFLHRPEKIDIAMGCNKGKAVWFDKPGHPVTMQALDLARRADPEYRPLYRAGQDHGKKPAGKPAEFMQPPRRKEKRGQKFDTGQAGRQGLGKQLILHACIITCSRCVLNSVLWMCR